MKLLAFDTSTETMVVGVAHGDRQWVVSAPGGAEASAQLIPQALGLLSAAGLRLSELDAIVYGQGPGSFTGLRTACAVAQGLALGADRPVLGLSSLLIVAEEARLAHGACRVLALLDARMDEIYSGRYLWLGDAWRDEGGGARLASPETTEWPDDTWTLAGNAFASYGDRLPAQGVRLTLQPTARAMLSLAQALLPQGLGRPAAEAMPDYVRNKVAQTTDERAAAKRAKEAGA